MDAFWKSKYVQILTVVLLLQATLFYTVSHGDSRPLAQPLRNFPVVLPGWQMISQGVVEQDTLDILKADDVLSRFYVKTPLPDLSQVSRDSLMTMSKELFVAYFSTQQTGQSPHSPKNCLPGTGWQQVETGVITLPIAGVAAPITINKYVVAKGQSQSLVLYWYQSHGRVVAGEYTAKFYLVADSLRYHRSDTALIRIVVPVVHDDLAGALDGATSFAQAAFPAIYHYLPM
jgi:EpsI family protein